MMRHLLLSIAIFVLAVPALAVQPPAAPPSPPGVSTALPSGQVIVGSSSNVATPRAMTGDVSITNAGATTVKQVNPAWNSTGSFYQNQLVTGSDGNVYRSVISANVNNDPTSSTECGTNWTPYSVSAILAIAVPSKCPTIAAAVTFSLKKISGMVAGTTVTINVADGTYAPSSNINLDSPFGRQFSIIGNASTPANVVINFAGVQTTSANVRGFFELTNGNGFGTINGFTYNGPTNSVCTPNCGTATSGYPGAMFLVATGKGSISTVGPNVVMSGGYSGLGAFYGAGIVMDGTKCSGGADGCYWTYGKGSWMSGLNSCAINSATPVIFSGSGYLIDVGSEMFLDGAHSGGNNNGVSMFSGSNGRFNGSAQLHLGQDCSGATLVNTSNNLSLNNVGIYDFQGTPGFTGGVAEKQNWVNYQDGSTISGTNFHGGETSNQFYTQHFICNGTSGASNFCALLGMQRAGQKAFTNDAASGNNILQMLAVKGPSLVGIGTGEHMGWLMDGSQNAYTLFGHYDEVRAVTAAGAITATTQDYVIAANKGTGAATVVNIAACTSANNGQHYFAKDKKGDAATNNITITPASGTIDGASTYVINTNRGAAEMICDGAEWEVIAVKAN